MFRFGDIEKILSKFMSKYYIIHMECQIITVEKSFDNSSFYSIDLFVFL